MAKKKTVNKKMKKAEKAGKTEKTEKTKSTEKQVGIAVWVMVGILALLIILTIFLFQNRTFEHSGITFKKISYGKIILYSAQVPVLDRGGVLTGYVPIDFRNDPRDLTDIPINIEGDIKFLDGSKVYVSINPEMEACEDNGLAMANLGIFFADAGLEAKSAFTNKTQAEEAGLPYKTCFDSLLSTIIVIDSGPQTAITQTANNCYAITYNNCEITRATERFQLAVLEQHINKITSG